MGLPGLGGQVWPRKWDASNFHRSLPGAGSLRQPKAFLQKRGHWSARAPGSGDATRGHRAPTPTRPGTRSIPATPGSLARSAAGAGGGARRLRRGWGGLLGSLARIKYLLCFVWPLGEGWGGLSHRSPGAGEAGPAGGEGGAQAPSTPRPTRQPRRGAPDRARPRPGPDLSPGRGSLPAEPTHLADRSGLPRGEPPPALETIPTSRAQGRAGGCERHPALCGPRRFPPGSASRRLRKPASAARYPAPGPCRSAPLVTSLLAHRPPRAGLTLPSYRCETEAEEGGRGATKPGGFLTWRTARWAHPAWAWRARGQRA